MAIPAFTDIPDFSIRFKDGDRDNGIDLSSAESQVQRIELIAQQLPELRSSDYQKIAGNALKVHRLRWQLYVAIKVYGDVLTDTTRNDARTVINDTSENQPLERARAAAENIRKELPDVALVMSAMNSKFTTLLGINEKFRAYGFDNEEIIDMTRKLTLVKQETKRWQEIQESQEFKDSSKSVKMVKIKEFNERVAQLRGVKLQITALSKAHLPLRLYVRGRTAAENASSPELKRKAWKDCVDLFIKEEVAKFKSDAANYSLPQVKR